MSKTIFRVAGITLAATLLLCALPAVAAAQTNTGQISGVVRDAQGGVLPGAAVVATHVESGGTVERLTDEQGRYHLPSLRLGTHVITVELAGFRRLLRSGVVVQLGQTLALDFSLEVGGLAEEVRVTVDVPLLQSTNAEISDVIENDQVVQIPLNGRNFLALAQLSDAVVIPPGGTRGDALQQAGPLPNVGGQRSGHNIYMLDGFKVTDELLQQSRHQSLGRVDPGVQDPEVAVSGRVRRQGVRLDQRRHARRRERVPREPGSSSSATTCSTRTITSMRGTSRFLRSGRTSSVAPSVALCGATEASFCQL